MQALFELGNFGKQQELGLLPVVHHWQSFLVPRAVSDWEADKLKLGMVLETTTLTEGTWKGSPLILTSGLVNLVNSLGTSCYFQAPHTLMLKHLT